MKRTFVYSMMVTLIIMGCLLFPSMVHAQSDPGCDPLDTPGCPIDGGLSALLIAGVGYGFKKMKDSFRK